MKIYKSSDINIPRDLNLTELLHTTAFPILESHLIASDSLTNRSATLGELRDRAGQGLAVARPHFVIAYGPVVLVVEQALDFVAEMLIKEKGTWTRPPVISIVLPAPGLKHISSDLIAARRLPTPHFDDTSTRLASIHLSSGTTAPRLRCTRGAQDVPSGFAHRCLHAVGAHCEHNSATVPRAIRRHASPRDAGLQSGAIRQTGWLRASHVVPGRTKYCPGLGGLGRDSDFSVARLIAVGGAPLKQAQLEKLLARAPWRLCQAYGMTEAAGYVAYQEYHEVLYDGCTGKLLPGIEACLKQEGGVEDVPDGATGEL
ncbi:4-coumarate-CoA ligase [Verticillium dahliae VdLs.17]|uniref:4-coumarate-CoA ligase n=1 Tax=Verticillium dahliae (strain VdLs.17 / ATCC MYA-4575 / FGSC 10137) TaxID=498257 RepID=G2WUX3_VERDV|nr:4-coumarate-CoA ligase [Verticillium dahliae VdLs.17]EGY20098.1 4-coumarate-CoA ligase [Verticillium dahliae VdLs.17]